MDRLRNLLSRARSEGEDEETQSLLSKLSQQMTLSWRTRLYWFLMCSALGTVTIVLSTLTIGLHKSILAFAVLYTFGSVISFASSFFLMGPLNQLRNMFAPTRIFAAILVISTTILTLVEAIGYKNPRVTLLFVILQWGSYMWYALSYIPFARDALRSSLVFIT